MSNDWESFKRGSVLEHIKISITVLHDFFYDCGWFFTWKSDGIPLLSGNANRTALDSRVLLQS